MTSARSFALVSIAALLLTAATPFAEAGGRRSASPHGGAPSTARSSPARSNAASRPPASAPGTASGRATYGYGHPAYYPPGGWGGWGGWYGPYWGWGGWWYPSYYGPYWGWPYVDAAPPFPRNTPGSIETAVTPKNASLRVDGEDFGRAKDFNGTWDSLRVAPGIHVLEFSREGYQTFRAVIDVRPGRAYRVGRELRKGSGLDPDSDPIPAPNTAAAPAPAALPPDGGTDDTRGTLVVGFLDLTVRPSDAAVYLDGTFLAHGDELDRLHGSIPVAAGTHRVEVVRPGHVPRTMLVEVSASAAPTTLEIVLEAER